MDDRLGALGLLTRPLDAGLALEMLRQVIDPELGVNIARRLATRLAAADGPANAVLRTLLDDHVSLAANYTSAAAVLAILGPMVFKP